MNYSTTMYMIHSELKSLRSNASTTDDIHGHNVKMTCPMSLKFIDDQYLSDALDVRLILL